jgi:twitching motility protein PilT
MLRVAKDTLIDRLLNWCEEYEASDLHFQNGKPFGVRIHGRLSRLKGNLFPTLEGEGLFRALELAFSDTLATRVLESMEVDLSFYHDDFRYRANFSKQQGQQSFSFRSVPQQRFGLEDLQLPQGLRELLKQPRGLVMLTGPTGQGKSTTVRALLQEMNETQALRVITIEDPIEYVFSEQLSQIEQREVGIDTSSFADGIRNAMRQDPDVIFVGEIRDRESIWAAMQAAETGHLVVTTLHADSVPQAIGRIREFYPTAERDTVSGLLARNINAIICQRLLPNKLGTRTPCLELMLRDSGVQKAIESNDLKLLAGIIEAATEQGMHSFDQYLAELLAENIIDRASLKILQLTHTASR